MSTHPNDLQRLAQKHGWAKEPLTSARVKRMGVQEYEFHQAFNKTELERALAEPQVQAQNKKTAEDSKAQRVWSDQASNEETETAVKEAKQFTAAHPQYICEGPNGQINGNALLGWLQEKKLLPTAQNWAEAFQVLGREGKLVLDPSKVGIIKVRYSNGQVVSIRREDLAVHQRRDKGLAELLEDAPEVTRHQLARHVLLDVLLSPYSPAIQEKRAQAALSADDYKKQNPDAFRKPTSALAEQQFQQAAATFLSFHPEYVVTDEHKKHMRAYLEKRNLPISINNLEVAYAELVREGYIKTNPEAVVSAGGGTKMIDLGGRGKQAVSLPEENESLGRKIQKMTAAEYAEFVANPTNRRAIDNQLAGVS
jgi:hypothetical protein